MDEVGHGADGFFGRDLGVWPMEVVEVDVVTAEAFEGSDDGREAILWSPVLSGGEG